MQPDFLSQTTLFIAAISPPPGFMFSNSASVLLIFPNKIKLIRRLASHGRIAWSSERFVSSLSVAAEVLDRNSYAPSDWVNARVTPGAQMAFWLQQEVNCVWSTLSWTHALPQRKTQIANSEITMDNDQRLHFLHSLKRALFLLESPFDLVFPSPC